MKVAVVRVRGKVNLRKEIKDTLNLLRLKKKNHCVVLDNTPSIMGMIKKVRDYITWGEINEDTFKKMLKKRGRVGRKRLNLKDEEIEKFTKEFFDGKKKLSDINVNPVFRLKPPSKGFERGGIKVQYPRGALGYRGEKINELLERMI